MRLRRNFPAFVFAQSAGNLVWGLVADRRGFRFVFLLGLAVWMGSVGLLVGTDDVARLVVVFLGVGTGLGGFQMAAQSLVLEFGRRRHLPMRIGELGRRSRGGARHGARRRARTATRLRRRVRRRPHVPARRRAHRDDLGRRPACAGELSVDGARKEKCRPGRLIANAMGGVANPGGVDDACSRLCDKSKRRATGVGMCGHRGKCA